MSGMLSRLLWRPSAETIAQSTLSAYQDWLAARGLGPASRDYAQLWAWSVDELDAFWRSIWDFFAVQADGSPLTVLGRRRCPAPSGSLTLD